MAFKKAERKHARLHLALSGPAGSGKTFTSLVLAHYIAKHLGKGRVAVIDTERGRSKLYAGHVLPDGGVLDFDVEDNLKDFAPHTFVTAVHDAEKAGYDVIVIDSTSHEWRGTGGVLEKVDRAGATNKWSGWRVGTPAHNEFIDAILQSKCHVIGTMRSKTEWILEETVNKQGEKTKTPKAVGMGVVQRDDTDYEFDFVGLFEDDHTLRITKTCFKAIDGKRFPEPGQDLAQVFIDWLLAGGVHDAEEAKNGAASPHAAEEVASAASGAHRVASSTASNLASPDPCAEFKAQIAAAQSIAALEAIRQAISAAHKAKALTDEIKKSLIDPWMARRNELSVADSKAETAAEPSAEPATVAA